MCRWASSEEYVRGTFWHTNTVENYFSILKRGINGVYHHVSEGHLHRYRTEFDFRYNQRISLGVNDDQRMAKAAKGIVRKRLTYRRTRGAKGPKKPAKKRFRSRGEKAKLLPRKAEPPRQLRLGFME
jgi:hypothetical protein